MINELPLDNDHILALQKAIALLTDKTYLLNTQIIYCEKLERDILFKFADNNISEKFSFDNKMLSLLKREEQSRQIIDQYLDAKTSVKTLQNECAVIEEKIKVMKKIIDNLPKG